jgi:hypothetical protein
LLLYPATGRRGGPFHCAAGATPARRKTGARGHEPSGRRTRVIGEEPEMSRRRADRLHAPRAGRASDLGKNVQHAVYAAHKMLNKGLSLELVNLVITHTHASGVRGKTWEAAALFYADFAEMRRPRGTDCGRIGSAEPLVSRRRPCRHRSSGTYSMSESPGSERTAWQEGMRQRKPGTTRGSPRRSRTAKASRISRQAAKSRCAREWGGWGRISDDGPGSILPD